MADITKSIPHVLEQLVLDAGIQSVTISTVEVTVPSITDADTGLASTTVAGTKVGDIVIATPIEALPTDCSYVGAYVTATDTVAFSYSTQDGAVTGAAADHVVIVLHRS